MEGRYVFSYFFQITLYNQAPLSYRLVEYFINYLIETYFLYFNDLDFNHFLNYQLFSCHYRSYLAVYKNPMTCLISMMNFVGNMLHQILGLYLHLTRPDLQTANELYPKIDFNLNH